MTKLCDSALRLKCPWCKSETISESHDDNGWFIGCVNNDCEIKPSFWADNEAQALKVWNSAKMLSTYA